MSATRHLEGRLDLFPAPLDVMLTISKFLSSGQARTYHAREFASEKANLCLQARSGTPPTEVVVGSAGRRSFRNPVSGEVIYDPGAGQLNPEG